MSTVFEDVNLLPFPGLPAEALAEVAAKFRLRRFQPGEALCRFGDLGESLFVIQRGVAEVLVPTAHGQTAVQRLRRGDVVGEMALLTDEPRSATVVALLPTEALELDRAAFAAAATAHPALFASLGRIVTRRLARSNRQLLRAEGRGEAVAVVMSEDARHLANDLLTRARVTTPRPFGHIDPAGLLSPSATAENAEPERVVAALDDLLVSHATLIVLVPATYKDLTFVLDQVDRTVAVTTGREVKALAATLGPRSETVELFLIEDGPERTVFEGFAVRRLIRSTTRAQDIAWLGRHITRTKLGVALGAGGAKGYAHVGALQVLEEHGYVVDYIAGCSIGAVVGMCLALGMNAAEIDAAMRGAFAPETVAAMFNLSFGGYSAGGSVVQRVWEELADGRTFADLTCPLIMLTVDLDAREPLAVTTGPLSEGLMAATALAGFVPPYDRQGKRLIDALALVPVPTEAVTEAGADVTVAVNLVNRRTRPAWPGETPPGPAETKRARMLDVLLDVMEMAQLDASVRHAAKADVVVEPEFGPATWREFSRADDFLAAGHAAMERELESLQKLAAT